MGRSIQRFSVALLLVCSAAAVAQDGDFTQGLLWRIEKGSVTPSYLFGTIHIDDSRVTTLPDPVRRSFDGARTFTMEVSLDSANLLALSSRMVYDDGRTLPDATGPELYRRIVPVMEQHGVPEALLPAFRPWAVTLLLEVPPQDSMEVLDFRLYQMAQEQHKPVYQLESADEQIAVFADMSDADQLTLLKDALDNYQNIAQQTEQLVQAYLARDLAQMWRIDQGAVGDSADVADANQRFEQQLLDNRNLRMAERMQPQLQQGGAFVAVGALHLYGERGILELLQRRGYRVSRVY
ncbi:MAG TPA: TraB/GumN family protein [Burkholderiales bacterium]|nr:TraB/GumN family protein [Burkholderiales bacterium]